ncbi:MAG: response regulator [Elusimicrobia bacterium]|nr:response regulator [Elusimicrobiota bacterium]
MANIMVVDDDPEVSGLIQCTLEAAGHQITVVENGREVIDTLNKVKPELLILDVMLPGIDGYSLASQIAESAQTQSMPIIVLSALEPSRTMFQKFSQVTAFMTKPFNTDDLIETVKTALTKK